MFSTRGHMTNKLLPGSYPIPSRDMKHYIVMLQENDVTHSGSIGRRQIYESGVDYTTKFIKKLFDWLNENRLTEQVFAVGEPMAFPMVAITCTPDVAKKIESLPEVEAVCRDTGDIGFIR